MSIFEFMSEHPFLTFFLAALFLCAIDNTIGNVCRVFLSKKIHKPRRAWVLVSKCTEYDCWILRDTSVFDSKASAEAAKKTATETAVELSTK